MKAIRGAITVEKDSPEQIREAVRELLNEIYQQNQLTEENTVCILFSNTADLRSFYPAKAAREAGFYSGALFSALEPEISGALSHRIRVMILAETERAAKHVYLRGAANLRRDYRKFSVALDGPSGSGKSTVAKMLAQKLNILYLDTGAMYRACALKAVQENVSEFTESNIAPLMNNIDLKIDYKDGSQITLLDGIDVSEKIRRPEVSLAASAISALYCVRNKMVEMQREIAAKMSCVLDGRDIGSYVLPDATFKFYITADSYIRAQRRYDELTAKGFKVEFDTLRKEIEERDYNDSHRKFSPLKRADDAILIETDKLSAEEVVSSILKKIHEKI